jgi:hypothetical protein
MSRLRSVTLLSASAKAAASVAAFFSAAVIFSSAIPTPEGGFGFGCAFRFSRPDEYEMRFP